MNKDYEAVIGLEIHVQLSTDTKLFCSCKNKFSLEPNVNTCPVCLGMPGVLPTLNERVVEYAVRLGLALNCKINLTSEFSRKSYFYPDLPKGYQITQFDKPICVNGMLQISDKSFGTKTIRINRIHIEEDAGKLIHKSDKSFFDANRCGVPLLEIVTEPDFRSSKEASTLLYNLRQLVRYLNISDGNMEEGSLRCDANISVRKSGEVTLGVKTELKNMNSPKNVEKAINAEIERQLDCVNYGEEIIQETLLWDSENEEIISMRSKEDSHDYRYFPELDLPLLNISDDYISSIRCTLPELPYVKRKRFINDYLLSDNESEVLTNDLDLANFYEELVTESQMPKESANWVLRDVLGTLKERKISLHKFPISINKLARIIKFIDAQVISSKDAKVLYNYLLSADEEVELAIDELDIKQLNNEEDILKLVLLTLSEYPNEVLEFKKGKSKLIGFFTGKVLQLNGRINPKALNKILLQELNK